ncbi:MAG TPA: glycosyltransferase family 4 protein [Caldilineae bacterium]|nr:glycosyltransferase family 4 protein [Caldilineae bacterium]
MTLRILAIAPTAFYNDYGCHVRIRGQLLGLQARGHVVRLATYPAGRDVAGLDIRRAPWVGVRELAVGSSRIKLLLDATLGPAALTQALRFRPHIIHAYLHEGALIGWALARWLGAPLTFDYQGSLTAEMIAHHFLHPRSPWRGPLERLEHWLDRRPRAILASTEHARAALTAHGVPPVRIHLLPDAVNPDVFHPQLPDPALQSRLGLDPAVPTLVYLGLLAPYQGVDLLLQALDRVTRPWQALIMGFPHEDRYRALARALGIGPRVRFTGAIPYGEAPRYLALGDLALAPKLATSEGSGKLLPYMSMALPIVATDTPAHRQYLGTWGLYAATEPDALARTLADALARLDHLQPVGEALRARVLTRYTWDHTARQMERIFRAVL